MPFPANLDSQLDQFAGDVFRLALLTGMRLNEIVGLAASEVFLEKSPGYPNGFIQLGSRTKTKKSRVIPLSRTAHEILSRRILLVMSNDERSRTDVKFTENREFPPRADLSPVLSISADAKLFPSGGPFGAAERVKKSLRKACTDAGISYGRGKGNGLTFHDTRHTAITSMLAAGADLRTVMDIAGHSSTQTALRYAHSTARSLTAAVELLDCGSCSDRLQDLESASAKEAVQKVSNDVTDEAETDGGSVEYKSS